MNEIITVFYSLAGLGLLLWIIMVEYPALQLEQTREKLYGLRRQLFCIGQKHQMFDKRAYTMNRYVINGMIRYSGQTQFLTVCCGCNGRRCNLCFNEESTRTGWKRTSNNIYINSARQ